MNNCKVGRKTNNQRSMTIFISDCFRYEVDKGAVFTGRLTPLEQGSSYLKIEELG